MDILDQIAGTPATSTTPESAPTTEGTSTETSTESTSTEAVNTENASTDTTAEGESTATYPDLRGTFATMDEAVAAGFTDLVTSKTFADNISVRNVMNGKGADGLIQVQNVYNAQKAKRHPIPVVLVEDTVYLPEALATTAWDNRPERGEGGSTTSGVLSDEDLARLTFRAQDTLAGDKRRLATLTAKIEKSQKLADKRNSQAQARFGDNWQEIVDKAGEDAEKSKEIPDTEAATA